MKQVVLHKGQAAVVDVPPPQAPPGGVLVRVAYSVISSGTERANLKSSGESLLDKARNKPELAAQALESVARDGFSATLDRVQRKLDAEKPSGYSCAGVVVQVGSGARGFSAGQAVACAGGSYANHAELVAVPVNLVCPVPDGVPLADAASVALGAIALQGVRQASIEIGETVLVIGLGLLGLLTVQMARASGATVIAVDPVVSRRSLARELGASQVADPEDAASLVSSLTGGMGADRTLLTAGTPSSQPLAQAMELTRKRGRVVVVGEVGLELKRSPFYEKEIELRISCSYGPGRYDPSYESEGVDYPAAYVRWTENRNMRSYLELLRSGAVQWRPLGGLEIPLEQATDAFALLDRPDPPLVVTLAYPAGTAVSREEPSQNVPLPLPARQGIIRLGIIGAGEFTRSVHIPNLLKLSDRFVVAGIANRTGLSARAAARSTGGPFTTTNYEELLARPDIDAVLIATRHDQHAELSVAALEAGKAVFLEKPLAMDQEQLETVLAAVERASQPFMVGFNRRFSDAARFVRDRIRAHGTPPQVLYRVNAGTARAGDWTLGPEGGGRAVGEACHMVDFLLSLAQAPVHRVQVAGHPGGPVPDGNFSVQLSFGDGMIATLVYTTQGVEKLAKERVEVFLGEEVVVIDDFRQAESLRSGRLSSRKQRVGKGHREEWEEFHAAWSRGTRLPIPLEQLRSVAEITFRIRDQTIGTAAAE
jgi:predicted dehydrogenase/threonine dehydrogenase-like Zn-dependent dehydrogenase